MNFKEFAVKTAYQAGFALRRYHGQSIGLTWKEMSDVKTKADDESDAFIRGEIEDFFPDHGILSEETRDKVTPSSYCWVVDPLDGTIPFSSHISNHWSVCIGLCRDRTPILGVIFCPERDNGRGELYVAEEGRGAFIRDLVPHAGGHFESQQRIYVSSDDDIHHVRIGVDPGKAPGRLGLNLIEAKLDADDGVNCVMRHGCASVPLCLVASGQMNAYAATRLEPWDMAAAVVICREAGAKVTDLAGKDWELGDESILVANPVLHQKLLTMLES